MSKGLSVLSLTIAAALVGACATKEESTASNVLVAAKVATPPVLDGNANDPAWAAAKPISVPLTGGMNFAGGRQGRDHGHVEGRAQRRQGPS